MELDVKAPTAELLPFYVKQPAAFRYLLFASACRRADGIVIEISRRKLQTTQYFVGLTLEEPFSHMPGNGKTGVDNLGKLWDTFHKMKIGIPSITSNGDEIGVTHAGTKEGYYRYFAGAQASTNQLVENNTSWVLEDGEYIVCTFEAENFECLVMDAVYKAHKYLFEFWLPNHKIITKPFAIESYASHNPDTTSMEVWVMPV